jgi:two-component sensor histidine kinase
LASILAGRIEVVEELATEADVQLDQILPITQIVTEVITNAIKHAYPAGAAGRIIVRSAKVDGGAIRVEVIDEGPGLPHGFDQNAGSLGLRLIRSLAHQLNASIEFQSTGGGVQFRLTLPAA